MARKLGKNDKTRKDKDDKGERNGQKKPGDENMPTKPQTLNTLPDQHPT